MLDRLEFPYKKSQVIISSGRLLFHAKDEAIILAGKRAVSICSTETINLDAKEKIYIDCDKIELGHNALESLILGDTFISNLTMFLNQVESIGRQLSRVSETNIAASMTIIDAQGGALKNAAVTLRNSLNACLSNNTYTK
jgi:hypothetical protein